MTIEDAYEFLVHAHSVLGRWPGVYGGYYLKKFFGGLSDPTFQNCWFWLSQYGPPPVVPPNWNSWTLWQYTDGAMGVRPTPVPGIGLCDRNYYCYCDTPDQLRARWSTGTLA